MKFATHRKGTIGIIELRSAEETLDSARQFGTVMTLKKAPAALCRQLIYLGEFHPCSFATKAKEAPTKKVSAAFKGGGQSSKGSAKEIKGEQSADKRFEMMLKVKPSMRKHFEQDDADRCC